VRRLLLIKVANYTKKIIKISRPNSYDRKTFTCSNLLSSIRLFALFTVCTVRRLLLIKVANYTKKFIKISRPNCYDRKTFTCSNLLSSIRLFALSQKDVLISLSNKYSFIQYICFSHCKPI